MTDLMLSQKYLSLSLLSVFFTEIMARVITKALHQLAFCTCMQSERFAMPGRIAPDAVTVLIFSSVKPAKYHVAFRIRFAAGNLLHLLRIHFFNRRDGTFHFLRENPVC